MLISDWSSDVCSSDLLSPAFLQGARIRSDNIAPASLRSPFFWGRNAPCSMGKKPNENLPAAVDFPDDCLTALAPLLAQGETVLAWLSTDLDPQLRFAPGMLVLRSEEHTSALQSLMR